MRSIKWPDTLSKRNKRNKNKKRGAKPMCTHEVSFHTPVSELCERITVCKWIYSCKQVISVSPQPYKKRKTKQSTLHTCRLKVAMVPHCTWALGNLVLCNIAFALHNVACILISYPYWLTKKILSQSKLIKDFKIWYITPHSQILF